MAEHLGTEIFEEMVESDTEFDVLDPNEDISAFFEVLDEDLELGEVVVGMVEEVSTSEASSEEKGESSKEETPLQSSNFKISEQKSVNKIFLMDRLCFSSSTTGTTGVGSATGGGGTRTSIILELVSKGLKECCRNNITSHYEEKYIDITRLVEASVNSSLDLVLPIRTNVGKELFIAFPFVGLVESPGAVFYNLNRQETRKAVVNMIMASLPAVALLLVWVCVFGVLFWICDIIPQRAILNRSFRVKCGEIWDSVWWSFVTLATVGYGDVVPTRIPGRILCYIWLMFSNVAIACFSATVTSILIAECFNSELTIEGSKIGVVNGSREHSFVLKSAGLPIAYKSITDLLDVLHVNTVDLDGILIDLYTASYHIHDLHTFRIQKIFEDVSTYGVVFRTRMVHIRPVTFWIIQRSLYGIKRFPFRKVSQDFQFTASHSPCGTSSRNGDENFYRNPNWDSNSIAPMPRI
ncbi:uncharacterized protein [Clytia hemisphaerica]|uniref:uncharacterized protein n=1 Tax=Clytia hemisphaerica TaxID=252671 RepID=UPI0034D54432